jgi:photosystem II stability/assembly factor-like uncharacterized protein
MSESIYNIYACTNGEYIYKLDWELGEWIQLVGSGKKQWRGITNSDTGDILVACAFNDYIYKSTNSGVTWSPVTLSLSKRNWTAICCSADCQTIIACATWNLYGPSDSEFGKGDYIYISRNSGASWTKVTGEVGANGNGKSLWSSVACSSGFDEDFGPVPLVIAAAELNGNIWVSKDSGVTWINSSFNSRTFKLNKFDTSDIVVSVDGLVISAVTIPNQKDIGNAYTSKDSGDNWISFPLGQSSNCVTCSGDGTIIAVGTSDSVIYTSDDTGFSFNQQFSSGLNKWSTITISPDNDYFVAAAYGGFIYTSTNGKDWILNKNSPEKQWIDSCIAADS